MEKRKQAMEESKANRQKELEASVADEDDGALERLIAGLRDGDTITRRAARRRRPEAGTTTTGSTFAIDNGNSADDTSHIARDMLARLKSDGFVAPPSPTSSSQRRRRRRTEKLESDNELPTSPLATEILEVAETSAAESQEENADTDILQPTP